MFLFLIGLFCDWVWQRREVIKYPMLNAIIITRKQVVNINQIIKLSVITLSSLNCTMIDFRLPVPPVYSRLDCFLEVALD
jgi:hypothetical protein